MVSSIQVISGNVSAAGSYYVALYYRGQEQGTWFGDAAPLLGLRNNVTKDKFQKMLSGQSSSGAQLVKQLTIRNNQQPESKHDPERPGTVETKKLNVLGVDQTDSVEKGLSVLWACSNAPERKRIESCVLRASESKNRWIEKNLKLARRGRNGKRRVSSKLVGASFLHTVSRAGEPQLHVHNVFSQLVYGQDGRWSKIDTKQLHTWTPTIGRIFRANLARELIKEFGLELVRPKDEQGKEKSWFTIAGIPKELVEANSSRRKAILDAIGSQGAAKGKYAALLRQHAAYNTRERKEPDINLDEMFDRVRKQSDESGLTKDKLKNLFGRIELRNEGELGPLYEKAFQQSLAKLTEDVAHFRECDIVREVVEELQHYGFSGSDLASRVMEDIPRRQELVQLHEHQGEKQFTTKEMWDLEAHLLEDVKELRGRTGANLTPDQVDRILFENPKLFEEQRKAVRSLNSGGSAIRLFTGDAGTGKSTALEAVRKGFEAEGYRVIGGALAGATTQDLAQKTGMKTRTVASYLFHFDKSNRQRIHESVKHHARMLSREVIGKPTWQKLAQSLDSNTVLVVDEAGMLSTKDLARLTRIVKDARSTLILAGDAAQLPAIGAGTPLKRLAKEINHALLSRNLRQQDLEDQAAGAHLRNGHIDKAFENYAARGRLVIGEDHFDSAAKLVDVWSASGGSAQPHRHVILTQTRSDAKLINTLCQAERIADATSIKASPVVFEGTKYYEGDRVLFHKRFRKLGIENGHFARITAVNIAKQEVTVRLERERTVHERARGLGQSVVIRLSDAPTGFLTLGFAATSHKLQGATVDHGYVLLSGPLGSKEMAYVQATRARFSTHLFADRANAGNDLEKLERALKRSSAKQMAHDLGKKHGQEQTQSLS